MGDGWDISKLNGRLIQITLEHLPCGMGHFYKKGQKLVSYFKLISELKSRIFSHSHFFHIQITAQFFPPRMLLLNHFSLKGNLDPLIWWQKLRATLSHFVRWFTPNLRLNWKYLIVFYFSSVQGKVCYNVQNFFLFFNALTACSFLSFVCFGSFCPIWTELIWKWQVPRWRMEWRR